MSNLNDSEKKREPYLETCSQRMTTSRFYSQLNFLCNAFVIINSMFPGFKINNALTRAVVVVDIVLPCKSWVRRVSLAWISRVKELRMQGAEPRHWIAIT